MRVLAVVWVILALLAPTAWAALPAAPMLPVPFDAVELVTANIPTAGTCFNLGYGLEQVSGGDRPTFARTGILFQARKTCSVEDVTPAEPWHSINKQTTRPIDLTWLDYPEYLVLFWTDRGGSPQVHWANVWKTGGTYGIFEDVVSPYFASSHSPVIWLSTNPSYPGLRLEMEVGLIDLRRFKMVNSATGPRWIEANDPPPTHVYLPTLNNQYGAR